MLFLQNQLSCTGLSTITYILFTTPMYFSNVFIFREYCYTVADSGEAAGMWWCRVSVAGSGESSHLAGKLLVTCCFSFQQKCVRNKLKETRKRKSLTLFSFLLRCHLVLQRVCYDDVLHHPVPEIYHLLLTNDVKNGVYQLCITSSALNQSLQCVTDCCLTTTR